jgi:hypothetical protein
MLKVAVLVVPAELTFTFTIDICPVVGAVVVPVPTKPKNITRSAG